MTSTMKRVFSKKKEDSERAEKGEKGEKAEKAEKGDKVKSPSSTLKRSKEEKEREKEEKREIKEKEKEEKKEIKEKEKEEKKREKEEKKPRVTFQDSPDKEMTPSPITRARSKTAPNKMDAYSPSPPNASSTKLIMSPSVGEILPPMPDYIELEKMFDLLLVFSSSLFFFDLLSLLLVVLN